MSKQLKLSATLSIAVMAVFALITGATGGTADHGSAAAPGIHAAMPALPAVGTLIPSLR